MNIKALLGLCWKKIYYFNIFVSDEDFEERQIDETVLKFQRYATRLYVVLFWGKLQ